MRHTGRRVLCHDGSLSSDSGFSFWDRGSSGSEGGFSSRDRRSSLCSNGPRLSLRVLPVLLAGLLLVPATARAQAVPFEDPYAVPRAPPGADASRADALRDRGDPRDDGRGDLPPGEAAACSTRTSSASTSRSRWPFAAGTSAPPTRSPAAATATGFQVVGRQPRDRRAHRVGDDDRPGVRRRALAHDPDGELRPQRSRLEGRARRRHAPPLGRQLLRPRVVRRPPLRRRARATTAPSSCSSARGSTSPSRACSSATSASTRPRASTSGWQIGREVAAGLEVFEAYAINLTSVRDGNRESLIVSPNVRLALPWVQPAISAFTNLGPPISAPWVQRESSVFSVPGGSATVWGFRFAFTVVYDPTSAVMVKGRVERVS